MLPHPSATLFTINNAMPSMKPTKASRLHCTLLVSPTGEGSQEVLNVQQVQQTVHSPEQDKHESLEADDPVPNHNDKEGRMQVEPDHREVQPQQPQEETRDYLVDAQELSPADKQRDKLEREAHLLEQARLLREAKRQYILDLKSRANDQPALVKGFPDTNNAEHSAEAHGPTSNNEDERQLADVQCMPHSTTDTAEHSLAELRQGSAATDEDLKLVSKSDVRSEQCKSQDREQRHEGANNVIEASEGLPLQRSPNSRRSQMARNLVPVMAKLHVSSSEVQRLNENWRTRSLANADDPVSSTQNPQKSLSGRATGKAISQDAVVSAQLEPAVPVDSRFEAALHSQDPAQSHQCNAASTFVAATHQAQHPEDPTESMPPPDILQQSSLSANFQSAEPSVSAGFVSCQEEFPPCSDMSQHQGLLGEAEAGEELSLAAECMVDWEARATPEADEPSPEDLSTCPVGHSTEAWKTERDARKTAAKLRREREKSFYREMRE